MVRETLSDPFDGQLGRRNDGAQAFEVALAFGPPQPEVAGFLKRLQFHAGVSLQPEARRLQNGGNRRANDVLTVFVEISMPARRNFGNAIAAVPIEDDLEHDGSGEATAALSW